MQNPARLIEYLITLEEEAIAEGKFHGPAELQNIFPFRGNKLRGWWLFRIFAATNFRGTINKKDISLLFYGAFF